MNSIGGPGLDATGTFEPGLQSILDFLSETIFGDREALPTQFFDDRFVREVNSRKVGCRTD
jgi:hypothetical protein